MDHLAETVKVLRSYDNFIAWAPVGDTGRLRIRGQSLEIRSETPSNARTRLGSLVEATLQPCVGSKFYLDPEGDAGVVNPTRSENEAQRHGGGAGHKPYGQTGADHLQAGKISDAAVGHSYPELLTDC